MSLWINFSTCTLHYWLLILIRVQSPKEMATCVVVGT
jgi:hypothetical protein